MVLDDSQHVDVTFTVRVSASTACRAQGGWGPIRLEVPPSGCNTATVTRLTSKAVGSTVQEETRFVQLNQQKLHFTTRVRWATGLEHLPPQERSSQQHKT
jgi:hypothetical protein